MYYTIFRTIYGEMVIYAKDRESIAYATFHGALDAIEVGYEDVKTGIRRVDWKEKRNS